MGLFTGTVYDDCPECGMQISRKTSRFGSSEGKFVCPYCGTLIRYKVHGNVWMDRS